MHARTGGARASRRGAPVAPPGGAVGRSPPRRRGGPPPFPARARLRIHYAAVPVPRAPRGRAIDIRRIDHVCLRVADLEEATRRWAIQFGLSVRPGEPG